MRNEFENIFKKKFEDFELQPRADLFDAIQAKRKKKKAAIWWWSAAFVVIAAITSVALLNTNSNSTKTDNNTSLITETNPVELDKEKLAIDNNKSINSELPNENNQGNSQLSSTNQPKIKASDKRLIVDGSVKKRKQESKFWAEKFEEIVQNNNSDITKAKLFVKNKELIINAKRNSKQIVEEENDKVETVNPISNSNNSLKDSIDLANVPDLDKPKTSPPPPQKPALGQYSVGLTIGPGYGSRLLMDNNEHTKARNSTESMRLGFATNLEYSYHLNEKWNINSGFNYVQRVEDFNYQRPDEIKDISSTTIKTYKVIIHPILGFIYKENGSYDVYDTTFTSFTNISNTNKYHSISIPIELERMFPIGDRFMLLAKTGVLVDIFNQVEGKTFDDDNAIIHLSTLKTNLKKQANIGLGVSFKATDKVTVIAYPQLNYGLTTLFKESSFKQKEYGIYTHFGIRIKP